jgi:hypothetical protein
VKESEDRGYAVGEPLALPRIRRAQPIFEGGALTFPNMPFGRWKGPIDRGSCSR